jgi:hypothetical protein
LLTLGRLKSKLSIRVRLKSIGVADFSKLIFKMISIKMIHNHRENLIKLKPPVLKKLSISFIPFSKKAKLTEFHQLRYMRPIKSSLN